MLFLFMFSVYLAVEAGTRSLGGAAASSFLGKLKCSFFLLRAGRLLVEEAKRFPDLSPFRPSAPKFFLQFQIARVNQANGVAVGAAGTVGEISTFLDSIRRRFISSVLFTPDTLLLPINYFRI